MTTFGPRGGATPPQLVRFGIFEFDFTSVKLTRNGRDLGLQQQPSMLLACLLERAGQIVPREELHSAIWPSGTNVEFDLALNTAVNRLRRVLGDSATSPRFIETAPKQGYRFIAPLETVPTADIAPKAPPRRRRFLLAGGAAAVLLILIVAVILAVRPSEAGRGRVIRYTIALLAGREAEALAIAPGGDQIVYQAADGGRRMLYRRYLDEEESRPIAGSEGGQQPFFSPDGQEVGFYAPGSLRVAGPNGTRDVTPVPADFTLRGAFWGDDGDIYFTTSRGGTPGIWRAPGRGGAAEPVLETKPGERDPTVYFGQQLLAGANRGLLYTVTAGPVRRSIEFLDASGKARRVVERGMGGRVLPTGHLLYYWRGSLIAVPFDQARVKLKGSPVEVLHGVAVNGWRGASAAVSSNGTLAYLRRKSAKRVLVWVAPGGQETPVDLPPAEYQQAEVSPDGTRIAIARRDDSERWSLGVLDLRTKMWTPVADSAVPALRAIWSPDGNSLVASLATGDAQFVNLYRIPLAAPANIERLSEQPEIGQYPASWSAEANAILYVEGMHPATQMDVMRLELGNGRRNLPLVATASMDRSPSFSPDGRRFAYASAPKGGLEVFVRAADGSGGARQISQGGGWDPLWGRSGDGVYYLGPGQALMEAKVAGGDAKQVFPPGFTIASDGWTRTYSIGKDGRFLVIREPPDAGGLAEGIHVVVNWFEELRRMAPMP